MATLSGGDKLTSALAKIAQSLAKPVTLRVGFLEDATYPDGQSVAEVAAFNEFGTSKAPARPFFRNMIADKSGGWPKAIAANLKASDYDIDKTMHLMGAGIKGQLQQAINDFSGVPLAASTIKRKGSSKQLIDTAHMLNSVNYEVES